MAHIPFPGSVNQTTYRTTARDRQDAINCFRYGYRSMGPVLKLTNFSNEGACIDFCLATDGLVIDTHLYDYNFVSPA